MPLPTTLQSRFISQKKFYRKKRYSQYQALNQALLKAWWMLPKGWHQELAACWTSKSMERIMLRPPFSEDCATKPTRERNGDEECRKQIPSSQRRKSRKNAHFRTQKSIFVEDKVSVLWLFKTMYLKALHSFLNRYLPTTVLLVAHCCSIR